MTNAEIVKVNKKFIALYLKLLMKQDLYLQSKNKAFDKYPIKIPKLNKEKTIFKKYEVSV